MAVRIVVEASYAVPADRVFAAAITYEDVKNGRAGLLVSAGAPSGACRLGDDFTLTSHLFGLIPLGAWRIRVVEADEAGRAATTEEGGGLFRRYRHRLTVADYGDGSSLYRDEIDFDAGWLTPVMKSFVRRLYRGRHRKRKAMLEGARP